MRSSSWRSYPKRLRKDCGLAGAYYRLVVCYILRLSDFFGSIGSRGRKMKILQPAGWREALEAKAAHPEAVPIFGGTDVMVELNFARGRPQTVLDLTRIPEIREWGEENGRLRVGAGVTYTRIIAELGNKLPGLAIASRTVGSPQTRNRGTVGGNLGTASPAGDGLPPLYASDAEVQVISTEGTRRVPVG